MPAADCEFSAFLRVMEVISSLDAEVSSSDAACSEAPCASPWLEEATCEDALVICSAPSASSLTVRCSTWLMVRTPKSAISAPLPIEMNIINQPNHRAEEADLVA